MLEWYSAVNMLDTFLATLWKRAAFETRITAQYNGPNHKPVLDYCFRNFFIFTNLPADKIIIDSLSIGNVLTLFWFFLM